MTRALLAGAALALSTAVAVHAQPAASSPAAPPAPAAPATAAAPAAAAAPATAANLKPGATLKDSSGGTIGSINRVGKTADGKDAVEVNIDGKPVGLPASMITVAQNGELTMPVTKAQIQAAQAKQDAGAAPPPARPPG